MLKNSWITLYGIDVLRLILISLTSIKHLAFALKMVNSDIACVNYLKTVVLSRASFWIIGIPEQNTAFHNLLRVNKKTLSILLNSCIEYLDEIPLMKENQIDWYGTVAMIYKNWLLFAGNLQRLKKTGLIPSAGFSPSVFVCVCQNKSLKYGKKHWFITTAYIRSAYRNHLTVRKSLILRHTIFLSQLFLMI